MSFLADQRAKLPSWGWYSAGVWMSKQWRPLQTRHSETASSGVYSSGGCGWLLNLELCRLWEVRGPKVRTELKGTGILYISGSLGVYFVLFKNLFY